MRAGVTTTSQSRARITVGTALAGGPPCRSQRAALPHWAPASGSGVEAHIREGMLHTGRREPPDRDAVHPFPVETVAVHAPSSMTPAFTHFRMSRRTRLSAIRCPVSDIRAEGLARRAEQGSNRLARARGREGSGSLRSSRSTGGPSGRSRSVRTPGSRRPTAVGWERRRASARHDQRAAYGIEQAQQRRKGGRDLA